MELLNSNPCVQSSQPVSSQPVKRLTIQEELKRRKALSGEPIVTKTNQSMDDLIRRLEATSQPTTTSAVVNSIVPVSRPIKTLEDFKMTRNELGENVHKQALMYIQNAQCLPLKGQENSSRYIYCQKINTKNGETQTCCVDKEKVLENISMDYKGMIKGLSKNENLAFKYLYKKTVEDFQSETLATPSKVFKEAEKIKKIENSVILKVATLQFLGDYICDHKVNKQMLDDKYNKYWI